MTASIAAFGKRVRFLRKLEGLTQARLAEQAGLSLEHLNKLERGAASPSFKALCQLARALHTEPANLLLFSDDSGIPEERRSDCLKHVSGLGAWRQDGATAIVTTSAGLNRLLGNAPRQTEEDHCLVEPLVVPADKVIFDTARERLELGEAVGPAAFRIRRPNGETRHVVAVAELIPGAQDGVMDCIGALVDVTEPLLLEHSLRGTQEILEQRVQERTVQLDATIAKLGAVIAEQGQTARSLRETEGRMRLILDSLPILVAHVDKKQRYIYVNDRFARYQGEVPSAYIGRTVREVIGEKAYAAYCRDNMRKALGGTRVIDEFQMEMADGSRPYFYAQWIPTRNDRGEVDAIYFWALDISERKFAEEILRTSAERFKLLVENLPGVYWVIDEKGLSYLSPAFEQYFGLPVDDAVTDIDSILERIHPDDRAAPERVLRGIWDEQTAFTYTLRVSNGRGDILLDVYNSPLRDPNGRIVQVVGMARRIDPAS